MSYYLGNTEINKLYLGTNLIYESNQSASTDTDILTFWFAETQTGVATIDNINHTIDVEMINGVDLTNLTPTISLSSGATISPLSGVSQDFTNPFNYTVTAEDGVTTQVWSVTVTEAAATGANLLFKTDFEGSITLGARSGGYRNFSGSSLGYTFPIDDYLGIWGTSGSGLHVGQSTESINAVSAELITTTGHTGQPTTVFHAKITNKALGYVQCPYQLNNFTTEPDEMYMTYYQKLNSADWLLDTNNDNYEWRALWEWKTANFQTGSNIGSRMTVMGIKSGGTEYLQLEVDADLYSNPAGGDHLWRERIPFTMPLDEWFKFEVYFKFRRDNTGAAWVKINGVTICEAYNVQTCYNNSDPFSFTMSPQLYGEELTIEHWVDDIEIWDGIPY